MRVGKIYPPKKRACCQFSIWGNYENFPCLSFSQPYGWKMIDPSSVYRMDKPVVAKVFKIAQIPNRIAKIRVLMMGTELFGIHNWNTIPANVYVLFLFFIKGIALDYKKFYYTPLFKCIFSFVFAVRRLFF